MEDELKRNLYIKYLSERHGIYESVLFRELEKQLGSETRNRSEMTARQSERAGGSVASTPTQPALSAIEHDLLKVMIEQGPEMIRFVMGHLSREDFNNEAARRVVAFLIQRAVNTVVWDSAGLLDSTTDESIRSIITQLIFDKNEISKGWGERDAAPEEVDPRVIAERCIERKKQEMIDRHIAENQTNMKAASSRGEDLRQYLEEHQNLLKQKQELRKTPVS
jgi:hypothetical protein